MISSVWREVPSKKRFKAFALWIPILFIAYSILPFSYEMLNQIPGHLIESKGILSVKKIGKNVYTTISDGQSTQVLTCASSFSGYTECLPHKIRPTVINKEAKALWYEQKVLPFATSNRLVELYVDGKAVITWEMSKERMARSKKTSIYLYFGGMILIMSISAFFMKKARES
ncbi:hypothetical protein [Pseudomonas sp. TCU-HL1]|uniref:hypothetical protein n=1 Tax=Pseudomonas sp. TCU-HL1 TaxID=1856685 RepID=UPI000857DE87|nr:hypothetical protein [Pseudomonas sp. TCU-HL1]AOE85919.1 hypothetical protein THL1_3371 [Pseudomonas sp. TCU-HL1]